MEESRREAKKRFVANITSNLISVCVDTSVAIWQTPYLIGYLGIAAYGLIPLAMSFIAYFNLATVSIAMATSRFVALHLARGQIRESNVYFNSSLVAIVVICAILLIPVGLLSASFSKIFQVPAGLEASAGWMFFCVMLFSFIITVNSPFTVSTFVKHRFDLGNAVKILGVSVRVLVLVLCFRYLSPQLSYFGLSYCAMAVFILGSSIVLTRYLTPELKINPMIFSRQAIRETGQMSIWISINQVGACPNFMKIAPIEALKLFLY